MSDVVRSTTAASVHGAGTISTAGIEIRRIDRVDDESARAAPQRLGEPRRQDRRGRAGQYGVVRRDRVEAGEHPSFDLDVFGRAFLDVARALQRFLQRRGAAHSRANGGRKLLQEPVRREVGQNLLGVPQSAVDRVRLLIPERDLMAGAREADRPGATDETQSDEGDFAHGVLRADQPWASAQSHDPAV